MYVVAVNDSHQGETYPAFLRLGILYYDFALTFGDEMKYVWQQPKSGASWLFIINRYFSFFAVRDISPSLRSASLRIPTS